MNIPRRIVVGIDGSPESLAALEWAVYEAECTCGEIDGGAPRTTPAWPGST